MRKRPMSAPVRAAIFNTLGECLGVVNERIVRLMDERDHAGPHSAMLLDSAIAQLQILARDIRRKFTRL